jgi:hypothetical protein
MTEAFLTAIWICLVATFCVALRRALRHCRRRQARLLRRYTHEHPSQGHRVAA